MSADKELTPWFPANVKPAHVGVYETLVEDGGYRYWNGTFWYFLGRTPDRAIENARNFRGSSLGMLPWRGLGVKP